MPTHCRTAAARTAGRTNDLTARTVARLKPDTSYLFRVRAVNHLGASG